MSKKLCPYLCSLLSALAVLVGCGKKQTEEKVKQTRYNDEQLSELEQELQKQELFCGSDRICPSYISKVAIVTKGKLKFCTGFLTEDNIVVTASSCLPEYLRMKDASCKKDITFFFAESNQKPTRVACKRVMEASPLSGTDPFLWRSDVAYLELETPQKRRTVSPSRLGMNHMDQFYIWTVDQIDQIQGIIRKADDCQSVHKTYFNPLATNEFSPVMTLAGCEFNIGNSGSPILDYRGRVRGVLSRPIAQSDIDEVLSMRILERPLKSLIHVSNYSCAPIIPQQDVASETECEKVLDHNSYDLSRRGMINESELFKSTILKIEHGINEKNRYLKMATELIPSGDLYEIHVYPKCFKNVSKWIGEFNNNKVFTFNIEIPQVKIKKAMNEFGSIFTLEVQGGTVPTNFQFKPSILRNTKQATVFMWTSGSETETFSNLSENCSSLL